MTSKSDQEKIDRSYRIVAEYGAFIEAASKMKMRFYPESTLPSQKEEIKEAIRLVALFTLASDDEGAKEKLGALKAGYMTLAYSVSDEEARIGNKLTDAITKFSDHKGDQGDRNKELLELAALVGTSPESDQWLTTQKKVSEESGRLLEEITNFPEKARHVVSAKKNGTSATNVTSHAPTGSRWTLIIVFILSILFWVVLSKVVTHR